MAVTDLSPRFSIGTPGRTGLVLGAVGGAAAVACVWVLATAWFGRIEWMEPYLPTVSIAIGAGAGYGALYLSGRSRGPVPQAVAVLATLVALAVGQALTVRFVAVWAAADVYGQHGVVGILLSPLQYWKFMVEGLFGLNSYNGTAPPGIILWTIALGWAITIPRRYQGH